MDTIVRLLPYYGITLMVPDNKALEVLKDPSYGFIVNDASKLLQLMAFHVWFPAYPASNLTFSTIYSTVRPVPYLASHTLVVKKKKVYVNTRVLHSKSCSMACGTH